ncbi:MAG: dihydrolipoyllysine-residue succinyltransferase [Vicinamibacterales bacterium]|nr:dihydrolipoyllysine-residue succinyltransferase [Vicinamibacterales bacterium]
MPTPVVMPQMGESVAEGTIVRWLKKVGDLVERDEPLFEISTDKVDAEIPSPAAGILSEIKVKEGETVAVSSVVAVIGEAGGASASASAPRATADKLAPVANMPAPSASAPRAAASRPAPLAPSAPPAPGLSRPWSASEARALRLSPLVRKIAREHRIDVRNIAGSGSGGRVTKADILGYLEAGAPIGAATSGSSALQPAVRMVPADVEGVERLAMTVMRRKIAEHMVMSRRTSAHVHSVFEVDFTRVDEIRKARKREYEQKGSKITYMAFITQAVAAALKAVPIVNSSIDGTDILYKKHVNIGMAVALDRGLIVPVIKDADKKSLFDISKTIVDLAARARDKKLTPDDVQGGTFTITNPGVFGALFGMPIINQPQVAILGVGAVEKRPVVIEDAITIRLRAYLCLGYDHRTIDGAIADEFMVHLKKGLEDFTDQA